MPSFQRAWYSPVRGFYMSEESQREEKAALLLEWTENEQELARQKAIAARISDVLYHVACELRVAPERLIFSGDQTPSRYMQSHIVANARGLDLTAIRETRDAIRALLDRQQELKPRKTALGLP
jgi:hypothetical protein